MLLKYQRPVQLKSRFLGGFGGGGGSPNPLTIPGNALRYGLVIAGDAGWVGRLEGNVITLFASVAAGFQSAQYTWDDFGDLITRTMVLTGVVGGSNVFVHELYVDERLT